MYHDGHPDTRFQQDPPEYFASSQAMDAKPNSSSSVMWNDPRSVAGAARSNPWNPWRIAAAGAFLLAIIGLAVFVFQLNSAQIEINRLNTTVQTQQADLDTAIQEAERLTGELDNMAGQAAQCSDAAATLDDWLYSDAPADEGLAAHEAVMDACTVDNSGQAGGANHN